ncbi:DUF7563 family protein [Halobellus sp. GM3]|uniref:DUF7563 family protein n=1 Tax=Halobellus sp. GM3 TaxID=3458410 RepID=UPI00403E1039
MPTKLAIVHDDQSSGQTRCLTCGSYVTEGFVRVFGDNENDLYACLECTTMGALRAGDGVHPD